MPVTKFVIKKALSTPTIRLHLPHKCGARSALHGVKFLICTRPAFLTSKQQRAKAVKLQEGRGAKRGAQTVANCEGPVSRSVLLSAGREQSDRGNPVWLNFAYPHDIWRPWSLPPYIFFCFRFWRHQLCEQTARARLLFEKK